MTGEEAYQRRLAMSTSFQPALQAASSASATTDATEGASATAMGSPVPLPRAETGEEAYLRRAAMSHQGPPPPLPHVVPAEPPRDINEEAYQRRVVPSSPPSPLPPSPAEQDPSELLDSSGYNPFAPQSVPLPPPPSIPSAVSASNVTTDFEERVRNSRNAAAAIAAKFSALAPPAEDKDSPESVPVESGLDPTERYAY